MLAVMRLIPVLAALLALSPLALAETAPPARPTPPASNPAPKQEEAKIPGVTLTRPDGRFLGVETEGVTLKVTFYDAKKKPEPADVARITARWSDTKPRFMVLLPSGSGSLVSPAQLRRPFNYIVYLALVGADDQVKESYSLRPQ